MIAQWVAWVRAHPPATMAEGGGVFAQFGSRCVRTSHKASGRTAGAGRRGRRGQGQRGRCTRDIRTWTLRGLRSASGARDFVPATEASRSECKGSTSSAMRRKTAWGGRTRNGDATMFVCSHGRTAGPLLLARCNLASLLHLCFVWRVGFKLLTQ